MATTDDVVSAALAEVGIPYEWGADDPRIGFDCSGLTEWVYSRVGIQLPRTARQQQDTAAPVQTPRPGDLVFYGRPAYHVGLYIGQGRMIEAPDVGQRVRITSVYGTPAGYGRVSDVKGATPVSAAARAVSGLPARIQTAGLGPSWLPWNWGGDAARAIVLEAVFVLGGLGLLGAGAWVAAGRPSVTAPVRRLARKAITP